MDVYCFFSDKNTSLQGELEMLHNTLHCQQRTKLVTNEGTEIARASKTEAAYCMEAKWRQVNWNYVHISVGFKGSTAAKRE